MSANLSIEIKLKGTKDELLEIIKCLKFFETDMQNQYREKRNCAYIHLTSLNHEVYLSNTTDKKETYYSQRVLPGNTLNIPGRHVADDGTVRDGDGFICVAADPGYMGRGSVLITSLGPAKVYDSGCAYGTIDIYASGPSGVYDDLEEVGLFEAMAVAAPGAWFKGEIFGNNGSGDLGCDAELKDGKLYLSEYFLDDADRPEYDDEDSDFDEDEYYEEVDKAKEDNTIDRIYDPLTKEYHIWRKN